MTFSGPGLLFIIKQNLNNFKSSRKDTERESILFLTAQGEITRFINNLDR